jgi:hypothetical protein
MRYEKRLDLLKDLFNTTDNVYVQHHLKKLEAEIEMSIMDAQIKVMNDNLNTIKQL